MRIKGGVRDKVKHKIAVKNITEDARLKPRNSRNIPFILSTTFVFLLLVHFICARDNIGTVLPVLTFFFFRP